MWIVQIERKWCNVRPAVSVYDNIQSLKSCISDLINQYDNGYLHTIINLDYVLNGMVGLGGVSVGDIDVKIIKADMNKLQMGYNFPETVTDYNIVVEKLAEYDST